MRRKLVGSDTTRGSPGVEDVPVPKLSVAAQIHLTTGDAADRHADGVESLGPVHSQLASLEQRLGALGGKPEAAELVTKLRDRKAQVAKELVTATKQEKEYQEIGKKIRAGDLTPAQQTALQKRLDELRFEREGGAFLDIGSIEAAGISGTVTSKEPLKLENILSI